MAMDMAMAMAMASSNNIFPFSPYRLVRSSPPYTSKTKSSNISLAAAAAARSLLPKRCQKCGGDRKEQEKRKYFRALEMFRLSRIWIEELS
ncbi:uncharacterized protein LOC120088499 isoform X2 [Benincasa hispida]|uniref:uncharacterized protein LOC120088499 isoform X2 n=1 Tax=Benincasa hispida TaxID=102211 RepID=UPI001901C40C|nr:uncharacterized protein LOC120088499 isoform X2 [Benincasa hispida]